MANVKRFAAILPLVLCAFLWSGIATAQTVAITQLTRDDIDPGRDVLSINRPNCVANGTVDVTVTVSSAEGDEELEVWAGTGTCAEDETRTQLNSTQCWKVFSDTAKNATLHLKIQDLLPPVTADEGEEEIPDICSQGSGTFTVWFLLVSGTVNKTLNAPTRTFKYDLAGPSAPNLKAINAGENSLILSWDASDANDITGYRIYCEERDTSTPIEGTSGNAGASASAGSAGTSGASAAGTGGTGTGGTDGTGMGGTDATAGTTQGGTSGEAGSGESTAGTAATAGTTPTSSSCRAATLREGVVPPENLKKGSTSQASESGAAKSLDNGRSYACGVAAYDDDGNIGVLSNLLCANPQPVIDYFEAYRAAGGQAGGGYCLFGKGREPGFAVCVGLAALALAFRRRRTRGAS